MVMSPVLVKLVALGIERLPPVMSMVPLFEKVSLEKLKLTVPFAMLMSPLLV